MNNKTISLCMIVKNEEKLLPRCLNSVKDAVDEIIIVDTGSTDNTVEIAKSFGAKVYNFKWIDDFSAARNYSLKYAACDYILNLDADEYIDNSVKLREDMLSGKDYYYLKINNFRNDYDILSHKSIRLFKNNIGLLYCNKLHETLNIYDNMNSLNGEHGSTIIYHTGYLEEIVKEKNKDNRNYRIMKKELEENPTGYNYYNIGVILYNQGNYKEALDMLKKSYPLSKNKVYVHSLISYMSDCLSKLDLYEKSIDLLMDAINVYPSYTDFYYKLGNMYGKLYYLNDAEIFYKKCLELGEPKGYFTANEGVGSYLPNYKLCLIYEELGNLDLSFEYAFKALELNINYRPALLKYIELMLKVNIPLDDVYKQISEIYPISNVNHLKNLLFVLYDLRHPLLIKYINKKSNIEEISVIAIALQYSKMYAESSDIWKKIENIPEKNVIDIILLSLILNDDDLLIKCKNMLNVTNKEWKCIKNIILKNDINIKQFSAVTEDILINLCRYLIILEEYDHFQYISGIIMNSSKNLQLKLAKLLLDYNLIDISIELLQSILQKYSNDINSKELLAKAYIKSNQYLEALNLLNELKNKVKEYWIYFNIYTIYDKLDNLTEKKQILKEMKNTFKLSLYLNTL